MFVRVCLPLIAKIIAMSRHVKYDDLSDEEWGLFRAFIEERGKDPRSPEKAPVEGISTRTLRRYLVDRETPSRLEDDTKVAMARYLVSKGVSGFGHFLGEEEPSSSSVLGDIRGILEAYRAIPPNSSIDWVPEMIGKILDSQEEGRIKLALVEAVIAGGRNHTAFGEAMAAIQRGVVMETESVEAKGRTEVRKIEAEEARRRREAQPRPTVEETLEAGALVKQPEETSEERGG